MLTLLLLLLVASTAFVGGLLYCDSFEDVSLGHSEPNLSDRTHFAVALPALTAIALFAMIVGRDYGWRDGVFRDYRTYARIVFKGRV